MFSFRRHKHSKIPILENKRRIKILEDFRRSIGVYFLEASKSETREWLNKHLPEVQRVIALAGISTAGYVPASAYGPARRVDILENLFADECDPDVAIDIVDRATGVYNTDQLRSWLRTFNPFFWIAVLIEWVAELPIWFVSLFGIDEDCAARSRVGRIVKGVGQLVGWVVFLAQGFEALQALFAPSGWGRVVLDHLHY